MIEETEITNISFDPMVAFWVGQINAYEKEARPWHERVDKIVKRYVVEKDKKKSSYNVLWSNVQTLLPALYDKPPTPNIERRFMQKDDLGREVSTILERGVSFFVDTDDFSDKIRQCVLDRLLGGRGVVWVRYVPTFKEIFNSEAQEGESEAEAMGSEGADDTQLTDDVLPELQYEDVKFDYVHLCDFGHTLGKTWDEVRAVWRRIEMAREDCKKRFGEEMGAEIPANTKGKDGEKSDNKIEVYEIWDKKKAKVLWISKNYGKVLDEVDNPLRLANFFPCPRPIYATLANDGLFPTPDYAQYYDQATELDTLTVRISLIVEALKVRGIYDASAEGVNRIMTAAENTLIPVNNFAVLGEKGGLSKVIEYFPIEMLVNVLNQLYIARDHVKQDMYEITGLSDIIRGASNANETATAQQIKGQYANMRLSDSQKDIARFCRDLVHITAEIISRVFSIDTIKQITAVQLPTNQDKMMLQQQQQMNPQQPLSKQQADMLKKPSWEDVEGLLRDDVTRKFRIAIETDSTIRADQNDERQQRIEFLTAAGGFLQQAAQIQAPELRPLLAEMLMFGVRSFKAGRELEGTFEEMRDKVKEQAETPPQPPPPDPANELDKARLELDAKVQAGQLELDNKRLELEASIKQAELMLKQQELQIKEAAVENKAQGGFA